MSKLFFVIIAFETVDPILFDANSRVFLPMVYSIEKCLPYRNRLVLIKFLRFTCSMNDYL